MSVVVVGAPLPGAGRHGVGSRGKFYFFELILGPKGRYRVKRDEAAASLQAKARKS